MKTIKFIIIALTFCLTCQAYAQDIKDTYWQIKVDFLEPVINQTVVLRADYGTKQHLFGVVAGFGGRISQFDNKQYDTYQDKINYRLGLEYQYFLSASDQNRGFYIGGDVEFGSRTVESKITNESVKDIAVFTPGMWFGYVWKPFENVNLIVDLAIVHPRYTLGNISKVTFQSVNTPYEPQNLFNFLGPWSISWRF